MMLVGLGQFSFMFIYAPTPFGNKIILAQMLETQTA